MEEIDRLLLLSVALNTVQLELLDKLEEHGYIYAYNLKYNGRKYQNSLMKTNKDLYANMPETAQIGYFNAIREIENKINNIDYAGSTETNL